MLHISKIILLKTYFRKIGGKCSGKNREFSGNFVENREDDGNHSCRMLRRRESLSEVQKQKLRESFSRNPALQAVYEFGQELCEFLRIRRQNKEQCRELVSRLLAYIDELCHSPFKPMSSLGRTLDSWKEEIARMFRFSKNNGITEGFHRKMKLIQRRAYGFRNFENYRLRVRVLCG